MHTKNMHAATTTRPARNTNRKAATAADVTVSATLGHFFGDRAMLTIRLMNGATASVVVTASCDLMGSDVRIGEATDFRHRRMDCGDGTAQRAVDLGAAQFRAAVKSAVLRACETAQAKADEFALDLEHDRAAKIEQRIAVLRAIVA